jgi:hypothetical protein
MMIMRCRAFQALLWVPLCLGCQPADPALGRVEGRVTLDGEPLANATVVFVPTNGRPSGASTDSDGKYVLNYRKGQQGALAGHNIVRILTKRDPAETPDGRLIPAVPERVPLRYNFDSILEFNVVPGKSNVADFDLVSEESN